MGLTLLSGVVIGVAGKWLYDNRQKMLNRRKGNVTVVETPKAHVAPSTTATETTRVPNLTITP